MNIPSLIKKLRYKDTYVSQIINLPKELNVISDTIKSRDKSEELCDFTLLFVKNKKEILLHFLESIECGTHDSIFWLAYPKKSGKIKSDLNRDVIWQLINEYGYRPVTMISIDNTWSAMRIRPSSEVGYSR